MDRRHLIAAEIFGYSFAHYAEHLGESPRFDRLMPRDVDILERDAREAWSLEELAEALKVDPKTAGVFREQYQRAVAIIDAPNPAEAFRRGVRFSIEDAVAEGKLSEPEGRENLVVQVCYRAADLAFLLDLRQEGLPQYSKELRREPGVIYQDEESEKPFKAE